MQNFSTAKEKEIRASLYQHYLYYFESLKKEYDNQYAKELLQKEFISTAEVFGIDLNPPFKMNESLKQMNDAIILEIKEKEKTEDNYNEVFALISVSDSITSVLNYLLEEKERE